LSCVASLVPPPSSPHTTSSKNSSTGQGFTCQSIFSQCVAVGGFEPKISIFDLVSGSLQSQLDLSTLSNANSTLSPLNGSIWITSLHFCDPQTLVSGSSDGVVRLWDIKGGKFLRIFSGHGDAVTKVQLEIDRNTLWTCSLDGSMREWDLVSGRCVKKYYLHPSKTSSSHCSSSSSLSSSHNNIMEEKGGVFMMRMDDQKVLYSSGVFCENFPS
jgi:WD40 repeat protein